MHKAPLRKANIASVTLHGVPFNTEEGTKMSGTREVSTQQLRDIFQGRAPPLNEPANEEDWELEIQDDPRPSHILFPRENKDKKYLQKLRALPDASVLGGEEESDDDSDGGARNVGYETSKGDLYFKKPISTITRTNVTEALNIVLSADSEDRSVEMPDAGPDSPKRTPPRDPPVMSLTNMADVVSGRKPKPPAPPPPPPPRDPRVLKAAQAVAEGQTEVLSSVEDSLSRLHARNDPPIPSGSMPPPDVSTKTLGEGARPKEPVPSVSGKGKGRRTRERSGPKITPRSNQASKLRAASGKDARSRHSSAASFGSSRASSLSSLVSGDISDLDAGLPPPDLSASQTSLTGKGKTPVRTPVVYDTQKGGCTKPAIPIYINHPVSKLSRRRWVEKERELEDLIKGLNQLPQAIAEAPLERGATAALARHSSQLLDIDARRTTTLSDANDMRVKAGKAASKILGQYKADIPAEPVQSQEARGKTDKERPHFIDMDDALTDDGGMFDYDYVSPDNRKYVYDAAVELPANYNLQDLRWALAETRSCILDYMRAETTLIQKIRVIETEEAMSRQHETSLGLIRLGDIIKVLNTLVGDQAQRIGELDNLLKQQLETSRAVAGTPVLSHLIKEIGSSTDPLQAATAYVLEQLLGVVGQEKFVGIASVLRYSQGIGSEPITQAVQSVMDSQLPNVTLPRPPNMEEPMEESEERKEPVRRTPSPAPEDDEDEDSDTEDYSPFGLSGNY
jgi:hypothetical protein